MNKKRKMKKMIERTSRFFARAKKYGIDHNVVVAELAIELGCNLFCVPLHRVTQRVTEKLETMDV